MSAYRVLICVEVLQIEKPSKSNRNAILTFLESLKTEPSMKGDFSESDEIGRTVQIKILGKYALTYWADHAVSEVKVTKIEVAD